MDAVVAIPTAFRIKPSIAVILGVIVAFLDMCLIDFGKDNTIKLNIYGCRFQTNTTNE